MADYRDAHNRVQELRNDETVQFSKHELRKARHVENVAALKLLDATEGLIRHTVGGYLALHRITDITMEDFDAYLCVAYERVLGAAIAYDPSKHNHAPSTHFVNNIK